MTTEIIRIWRQTREGGSRGRLELVLNFRQVVSIDLARTVYPGPETAVSFETTIQAGEGEAVEIIYKGADAQAIRAELMAPAWTEYEVLDLVLPPGSGRQDPELVPLRPVIASNLQELTGRLKTFELSAAVAQTSGDVAEAAEALQYGLAVGLHNFLVELAAHGFHVIDSVNTAPIDAVLESGADGPPAPPVVLGWLRVEEVLVDLFQYLSDLIGSAWHGSDPAFVARVHNALVSIREAGVDLDTRLNLAGLADALAAQEAVRADDDEIPF